MEMLSTVMMPPFGGWAFFWLYIYIINLAVELKFNSTKYAVLCKSITPFCFSCSVALQPRLKIDFLALSESTKL